MIVTAYVCAGTPLKNMMTSAKILQTSCVKRQKALSQEAFQYKMMTFDVLRLTLWLKKYPTQGANDAQAGYLSSYQ